MLQTKFLCVEHVSVFEIFCNIIIYEIIKILFFISYYIFVYN